MRAVPGAALLAVAIDLLAVAIGLSAPLGRGAPVGSGAGVVAAVGVQTPLLVALLARERAVLAVPMAFVFAALRTGSSFLAATGVDRRIANVVQAMLVLALLIPPAIQAFQARRGRSRA